MSSTGSAAVLEKRSLPDSPNELQNCPMKNAVVRAHVQPDLNVEVSRNDDLLGSARMRQEALDSVDDAPGLIAPETQAAEWNEALERY